MDSKTLTYILKRIVMAVFTLWAVITITFFVMHAVPGGPFTREKAISAEAQAALNGEPIPERPPLFERCDTAVRQIELATQYNCEKIAVLTARRHYAWYLKGVSHSTYYKEQIVRMETLEDVYRVTAGIKRDLHD